MIIELRRQIQEEIQALESLGEPTRHAAVFDNDDKAKALGLDRIETIFFLRQAVRAYGLETKGSRTGRSWFGTRTARRW